VERESILMIGPRRY